MTVLTGGGGCKSASKCVSPRIEGRVLDAQSREPIKDVRVRRVNPGSRRNPSEPPKGAQLMEQSSGVATTGDGTFHLDSLKNLTPFRQPSWYSVTIAFEHRRYQPLRLTYTVADATNRVAGDPTVKAGDVLLEVTLSETAPPGPSN